MAKILFELGEDLNERIESHKKKTGINKASICKQAILDYLKKCDTK